ncbi:MAG: hypothetical protein ACRDKY_00520 [Solirubrobacteraceae bacterium]
MRVDDRHGSILEDCVPGARQLTTFPPGEGSSSPVGVGQMRAARDHPVEATHEVKIAVDATQEAIDRNEPTCIEGRSP